ncbi:MAG: hypothetical protein RIC56_22890 [Pseudomonadales bacterium]
MVRRVWLACLGVLACQIAAASQPDPAGGDGEPAIEQLLANVVEERLREVEPILRTLDVSRVRIEQLLRLCGEQEEADRLREIWWSNAQRRISAAVDAHEPERSRRDYLLRILTGVNSFELGMSAALAPFVDDQACETALEAGADL